MICSGCWRTVPTSPHDSGLDLCAGCVAWLRMLVPMGLDGSEGAKLARRMLETWRQQSDVRAAYALGLATAAAAAERSALDSVIEA